MEYNQIPKTGTIGGMVDNINANFQLTKEMLERLEVTKDHAVGLFSTLASLQTAYPSPEVGDWALVGDTTPFAIYKCSTAGTWSDTGGTYDGGTIDLTDYVTKDTYGAIEQDAVQTLLGSASYFGTTSSTGVEYVTTLKAGTKYEITAQTSTQGTAVSSHIGLWVKNSGGTETKILQATAAQMYAGQTITYTPTEDVSLGVRMYQSGIAFTLGYQYVLDMPERIQSLQQEVAATEQANETVAVRFINTAGRKIELVNSGLMKNGVVDTTADGYYSDYIRVDNASFSVWTYGGTNYTAVNYFDASKNYLSSISCNTGGNTINVITPPTSAVFAVFASNDYYLPTVAYVTADGDNISDEVTMLKELLTKQTATVATTDTSVKYVASLTAGVKYFIKLKSTGTWSSTSSSIGLWVKNSGGTQTKILRTNPDKAAEGISHTYTPAENVELGFRAYASGVTFTMEVLSAEDITKIAESAAQAQELINKFSRVAIKGGTTSSTGVEYVTTLKAGTKYEITAQTSTQGTAVSSHIGLWVKNSGGTETKILQATAAQMYAGQTITYTPTEDVSLGVRMYQSGIAFTIGLSYIGVNDNQSQWQGASMVVWGDSITAMGNGRNNPDSYMYEAFQEHEFDNLYARGIGGQTIMWNDDGFYTNLASLGEYLDRYNYDEEGNRLTTLVKPATITAQEIANIEAAKGVSIGVHYGAFCSWDRITTMIPSRIRESIDLVVICGGTNDFKAVEETEVDGDISSDEPLWVPNNAVDPTWAADTDYYNGGDYDLNTLSGALASTVMKMRLWCPNAVVVVATPFPKFNPATKRQYVNSSGLKMSEFCEYLAIISKYIGAPVIRSSEATGIDGSTFTQYVTDSTHPNEEGRKLFARTFVGALKNIAKKI